ncbi:phospho-sugar mutase [Jatrophihabitans fulvus]
MTVRDDVRQQVEAWLADEVHDGDAAELRALLERGDGDELADRFAAPLTFGTAGLRGPLRAGPNGMNLAVVRRAAAGVAAWLADDGHRGRPVVVGFDGRYRSHEFALDSARVFAAAGFDARVMPQVLPTPVLAFAVQHLDAAAGVMVTASHNPPRDNGYKVYADDGAQIAPPSDSEIESRIEAVTSVRDVPLDDGFATLGDDLAEAYVAAVAGLVRPGPRQLRIVHTAMHGVGTHTALAALARAGFTDVTPVPEQEAPDPDFPTVSFPNPEEPGALDLALGLARERGADLVIANDPDADRCAVAVPTADGGWRALRGDELGVLLGDALMREGVRGTYATTIVSSSMLGRLAAARGFAYAETLTGFKWISRAADDLVFGYEEAIGYAVAPHLVRDKDGVSAAVRVADLAARLAADGSSLLARLDELAAEVGRHATDQVSVRVDDLSVIGDTMARLRQSPPTTLVGADVTAEDLLPATDGLRWRFEGGRVVVRPSGTEPKLKAYLEIVSDGSSDEVASRLARLRDEVSALVG